MRAEIRAGELLTEMAEKGERDSGRGNRNPTLKSQGATPKLSDIGVSKSQSSRWQQLAALPKEAMRIQSRAVRQCGVLLKQIDARGDHRKSVASGTSSQRDAARDVGMSKRQQITAIRVASVPDDAFEEAVESAKPPTVQSRRATRFSEKGSFHQSWRLVEKSPRVRLGASANCNGTTCFSRASAVCTASNMRAATPPAMQALAKPRLK